MIIDPAVSDRIQSDYSLSGREGYTDVAIVAYEAYENLEFLRECNMWPSKRGPTWTPDWSWVEKPKW